MDSTGGNAMTFQEIEDMLDLRENMERLRKHPDATSKAIGWAWVVFLLGMVAIAVYLW